MVMVVLINIGIALTSFAFFPIQGDSLRVAKELSAIAVVLSLLLTAIYKGTFKQLDNFWLLMFVAACFISAFFAPGFKELILGYVHNGNQLTMMPTVLIDGMWMFRPLMMIVMYLLFATAIASYNFTDAQIRSIIFTLALCGFITALYIFVQKFNLDQFFSIIPANINPDVVNLPQPKLGGFIGHATLTSPYIAMLIPLAVYLKKYIWAAIMAAAVLLTESKVAITAMMLGMTIYFAFSPKKTLLIALGIFLIMCCSVGYTIHKKQITTWPQAKQYVVVSSHGRTGAWQEIWKDFTSPVHGKKRTITGFGPGAFKLWHSIRGDNRWDKAHCDPLEGTYNFGIVAMWVFLPLSIRHMLRKLRWSIASLPQQNIQCTLLGSLMIVTLCSFATFPFQIEPMPLITVLMIGLLHNKILRGQFYGEEATNCGSEPQCHC